MKIVHLVQSIIMALLVLIIMGCQKTKQQDWTPNADWGHNLDAFNDILRGGFGTPDGGFVLRWINSRLSQERLGHYETVRQLEYRPARCHHTGRSHVIVELASARQGQGPTGFD